MCYRFIVIALLIKSLLSISTDKPVQGRNALIEYPEMIRRLTGRNAYDYFGYGCYCGFGGKGKSVDAVDECCQAHEQCYNDITTYRIFWARDLCSPHVVTYPWSIDNRIITCVPNNDICGYRTCMCDKIAAECFARNAYNDQYRLYSRNLCVE